MMQSKGLWRISVLKLFENEGKKETIKESEKLKFEPKVGGKFRIIQKAEQSEYLVCVRMLVSCEAFCVHIMF